MNGYGKEKGRLNIKKRRKEKINISGSVDETPSKVRGKWALVTNVSDLLQTLQTLRSPKCNLVPNRNSKHVPETRPAVFHRSLQAHPVH